MLQQTRVSAVIPYYLKWMKEFPTLLDLAKAPTEKIIKLWEGLGYYQRARNLQTGAKQITQDHQGVIPEDPKKLEKIKGIGPYTLNAILALGFHKTNVALDGNVKRVLARFFAIQEDLQKAEGKKKLEEAAQKVASKTPFPIAEALIELGALVCQKKPICSKCPLQKDCEAKKLQKVEDYPVSSKRQETIKLKRVVFLLEYKEHLLVKKEQEEKVMKDLYQFLYDAYEIKSGKTWEKFLQEKYNTVSFFLERLLPVKQSYTKYQVTLYPLHFKVEKPYTPLGFEWAAKKELEAFPFSAGHRKILHQWLKRK